MKRVEKIAFLLVSIFFKAGSLLVFVMIVRMVKITWLIIR